MSSTAILNVLLALCADSSVLTVNAALLSPVEDAEIAARQAGAITDLRTHRGQTVEQGQWLAQIDDEDAQVDLERAKIELQVSREEADNDVAIRHARKTLAVAETELKRAAAAVKKYRQSISEGEMDRLRLTVERDKLAVEQSEHEHQISQATMRLKENALKLATLHVEQRKVVAPFAGIVADIQRSRGEWARPGDVVLRLLRIDRVHAEGFVDARYANAKLLNRPVQLSLTGGGNVTLDGKVVFVSPEVDAVNGQLLICAEIENPELTLRPGQRATFSIALAPDSAAEAAAVHPAAAETAAVRP